MASLSDKLSAALKSRERRLIRRRLPEQPSPGLSEIDFTSNDYLSLATSSALRQAVLSSLASSHKILGSGGSRLLVPSQPHVELESRLCRFFGAEAALLFNSGFDANVGFFSAVPQPGDVVLYDAHIHASVHDGMRLSRLTPDSLLPFPHNSVDALRVLLARLVGRREDLKRGKSNVFVAVEGLYSMDGTVAPLLQIVECVEQLLPLGNGYVIVDEAHSTGIYGPNGRGLVVELGLEKRVFARLHTFGKALASSGAVILVTNLVKDYLLNYARSLIYTTTFTFANIIAINCSFDMLEDGTTEALSTHLLALSTYFVDLLRAQLKKYPSTLLRLPDHLAPITPVDQSADLRSPQQSTARPWEFDPRKLNEARSQTSTTSSSPTPPPTPIVPILTPEPRALASFLLQYVASSASASSSTPEASDPNPSSSSSPNARPPVVLHTKPIYPPTVPQGTSRVRICLHAGHTQEDVDLLVQGIVAWAEMRMAEECRARRQWLDCARNAGLEMWMASKL